MKLILAALTALVAATMAAPSAEAAPVPAVADVLEARKCLRAGAVTKDFTKCCSGSGYADKGCACTRCS
jgi:hypothetical protein